MSQTPQQPPSQITPEDARRIVIVFSLLGAASREKLSTAWLVDRAFNLGDRVREFLEAEERGAPHKHWSNHNPNQNNPHV